MPAASAKPARLQPSPADFRRDLLAWFDRSGRHDLPWRNKWTAYAVLVSEFMLQQTTVSTVIPYFERFMKEFPTLKALAAAPQERVLELWSGLGYYARARNLHAAAKRIVEEFGGRLPETSDEVRSLPGVGRYTAGALLSFCYDKPEPVVDGNVIRVLSRIYGLTGDVKRPAVQQEIWALSWKLVPPGGARRFNSAIMDLGATVCRPASPDCLVCPFFKSCWARRQGRQEELPKAGEDRPRAVVHVAAALVERAGRWLLVQRPEKGLYAGLWEFPGESVPGKVSAREAASLLEKRLGAPVKALSALPSVKHVLSHREMHVHPWFCELKGSSADLAGRWFSPAEIEKTAISSLTRKILPALESRAGGKAAVN